MVNYNGPPNAQVQKQYGYEMQVAIQRAIQPILKELIRIRAELEEVKKIKSTSKKI